MAKLSLRLSKYDLAIVGLVGEVKRGLEKTDPILGQIQSVQVAHGGTLRQVSEPKVVETSMKEHGIRTVMDAEWFRTTDIDVFIEYICTLCDSFNSSSKHLLFELLSKTTEATGNSFDARGRNMWDALIEVMRETEIHFDENGNHDFKFVVNPITYEKISQNPPTPEQKQRMDELIQAKREEFYAKKRTRRLS